MATKSKQSAKMKTTPALRASVSFPPEIYRTLEQLAEKKKVSFAWIVRDAAEKYIAEQWPLFGKS
ncbi:Ribbon-helix-helix protein, copG family [Nitrosospira briensis]|uniref:Ribbon-helix-helix protein, copG family n=1 Tax=Nitrosospira briensis TaxID=35799 RepID=A0A1I4XGC2_9PROT|nr:CopG family transcriptional regulator [Nitrosospira briensis]SFN24958.1 Ribbon-helix-helix protein, copG family [Nitrosospira briensis]